MHLTSVLTALVALSLPAVLAIPSLEELASGELIARGCPGGSGVANPVCPGGYYGVCPVSLSRKLTRFGGTPRGDIRLTRVLPATTVPHSVPRQ